MKTWAPKEARTTYEKHCKNMKPLIATKVKSRKLTKGCVNQPISLLEPLQQRGYADPTLSGKELPNDKQCRLIAKNSP